MDIEKKKEELFILLRNIEDEATTLIYRVANARADLYRVKTEEDAREYDATHDLEEGFKHIELF